VAYGTQVFTKEIRSKEELVRDAEGEREVKVEATAKRPGNQDRVEQNAQRWVEHQFDINPRASIRCQSDDPQAAKSKGDPCVEASRHPPECHVSMPSGP